MTARVWMNALALGVALAWIAPVQAQVPSYERVRVLSTPRAVADAELTDHLGRPFRLTDLRGEVAFVLFGFTNCPDVCPVAVQTMRDLERSGTLAGDPVSYVMISVDGERDTPAVMKSFLARFSDEFIGLTAPPAVVKPIAAQFSAAFFKGNPGRDGGYDVAHSPQIFVLDTKGRLRAEIFGASLEAMAGVAAALLAETP